MATWRPDLICDESRAEERAQWLVNNRGMQLDAARQQVMREFPALFGARRVWSCDEQCGGIRAEERAHWLVENLGMALEAARERVMDEFPAHFLSKDPPAVTGQSSACPTGVQPSHTSSGYAAGLAELSVPSSLSAIASGVRALFVGKAEPNPPNWPESVKILSRATGYKAVDEVYAEMAPVDTGQFSTKRYALLFEASDLVHEVDVRVGYYTSVYGLGRHPANTKIRSVTCTNETASPELGSLQNFWRSAENFQTGAHPTYALGGQDGMLWAVSQAAPLRRAIVDGNIYLWYFRMPPEGVTAADARYPLQGACLEYPEWVKSGFRDPFGDFASGGFMANVSANGFVSLGSQQQFFLRNCSANEYKEGAWNFVFVGCPGATSSEAEAGSPVYTTISETKVIAEKPFIIQEGGLFKLAVPGPRSGCSGADFNVAEGELRDFEGVFVAQPSTSAAEINQKLGEGKDVVFTPGIYQLSETINVSKSNQVLLGLGFATLVSPDNDTPCILVHEDATGVRISGFMLEAAYKPLGEKLPRDLLSTGPDALLQWGSPAAAPAARDAACLASWSFIHDCFARVGGQEAPYTARDEADHSRPSRRPRGGPDLFASEARCKNMVQINVPCVAGDNLWLWRADHWLSDQYLVYNHENCCHTGLHVSKNASHVTMYGLFVEHTLSDMTLWEGEHGTTFFYQSELPYDALKDDAASTKGQTPFTGAGYRVADGVVNHEACGIGVYAFFRDHDVSLKAAVRVPDSKGVVIKNALTKYLNGGPATYSAGKGVLDCAREYGRIESVIAKGGQMLGKSTSSDKEKPHFASG